MKTIIAGSRDITDYALLEKAIKDSGFLITEVVCGGARGVDELGHDWGRTNCVPIKYFFADWAVSGKRAGIFRNTKMAKYAEALICIHHGTTGSLNMVNQARHRGLKVFEVKVCRQFFHFHQCR